ncbi:LPXTG cell wall anchor domain-containing protein [Pseudactinotalea suaedae]
MPDTGSEGVGTAALVAGLITLLGGALVAVRGWSRRTTREELPLL